MSAALTATDQSSRPEPHQVRPAAGAGMASRGFGLLGLVRKLIDYGKELAGALRQGAPGPRLVRVARDFATIDIVLILACVTRGLHRLAALEARLIKRAGRKERAAADRTPTPRKPRAARHAEAADAGLADPPTLEKIVARDRRRPVGAVIADICRDLGIAASHPLWRDLQSAVDDNGGNLGSLDMDMIRRVCVVMADAADLARAGWPLLSPPLPAASAVASGAGPP
jgi:hypothetical protein